MVSPLLIVLLSLGEVVVTDWVDGRLIPTGAGAYGLADQVATAIEAATTYRAPAHLVALSQSGPAALAASAMLAASSPTLAPSSLAFLGCQLEPRVAPTALQQALGHWPRDMLAASLTCEVAPNHPGAGRRVYPALFQLLAYGMASPGLYAEVQQGLLREIAAGQAGAYARQHGDLHSLLDVPGELFVEMLDWALDPSPWRGDGLVLAGAEHEMDALRAIPVLTLEAGGDELVGRGQTHALAEHAADGAVAHRTQRQPSRPVHRPRLSRRRRTRAAPLLRGIARLGPRRRHQLEADVAGVERLLAGMLEVDGDAAADRRLDLAQAPLGPRGVADHRPGGE